MSHKWRLLLLTVLAWIILVSPVQAIQFGDLPSQSSYPGGIDTVNTRTNAAGYDPCSSAVSTNACAEFINGIQDAVVEIETELGINPSGSYADVAARLGDLAPKSPKFWVGAADATLSGESDLGALTTGLVLNTVTAGVGVPSIYSGTLCTNMFTRSLNPSGAATCASVSLTTDVSGILPVANGGTASSTAQAAINTLTAVSGATNEHVLTKDTATGNAIFKSAAGGSSITASTATVATEETTSSTSFTDLATSGPSVTFTPGASGKALITITTEIRTSGAGDTVYMSFALSSGNTLAASTARSIDDGSVYRIRASYTYLATGLAQSSTTATAKYAVAASTGYYGNREISVLTW